MKKKVKVKMNPTRENEDVDTTLLCLSCGIIQPQEYKDSPALSRMHDWQDKLSLFWGKHPYSFYITKLSMAWFAAAIICAYFDELREYTTIFLLFAVVTAVGNEFIPLTPVPFNVHNVVTSRADEYSTAVNMMIGTLFVIGFFGVFIVMSEQAGNVAHHAKTNYQDSPPSYWGVEPLPWLTVILVALPLAYFSSLVVSAMFVSPYINKYL